MTPKVRRPAREQPENGAGAKVRKIPGIRKRRDSIDRGVLNLRLIEIFVTTVDEQGLTPAAKRLSLTQSAV